LHLPSLLLLLMVLLVLLLLLLPGRWATEPI
jgi:hypothetical protein